MSYQIRINATVARNLKYQAQTADARKSMRERARQRVAAVPSASSNVLPQQASSAPQEIERLSLVA